MKLVVSLSGVALALTLATAHAQQPASDYKVGALQVSQPWSRATPKGAAVAGGYFRITNTGTTSDRLTGGSSAASGRFEIHEMSMDNGVMKMRPLKDGLEIKPGQTVEFKPGSYHVMMLDLKQPLNKGDHLKGTLTFEKAGPVDIEYNVVGVGETPGASAAGAAGHDMPGMRMSH
jgi:copper(I)-binding protein